MSNLYKIFAKIFSSNTRTVPAIFFVVKTSSSNFVLTGLQFEQLKKKPTIYALLASFQWHTTRRFFTALLHLPSRYPHRTLFVWKSFQYTVLFSPTYCKTKQNLCLDNTFLLNTFAPHNQIPSFTMSGSS